MVRPTTSSMNPAPCDSLHLHVTWFVLLVQGRGKEWGGRDGEEGALLGQEAGVLY